MLVILGSLCFVAMCFWLSGVICSRYIQDLKDLWVTCFLFGYSKICHAIRNHLFGYVQLLSRSAFYSCLYLGFVPSVWSCIPGTFHVMFYPGSYEKLLCYLIMSSMCHVICSMCIHVAASVATIFDYLWKQTDVIYRSMSAFLCHAICLCAYMWQHLSRCF